MPVQKKKAGNLLNALYIYIYIYNLRIFGYSYAVGVSSICGDGVILTLFVQFILVASMYIFINFFMVALYITFIVQLLNNYLSKGI